MWSYAKNHYYQVIQRLHIVSRKWNKKVQHMFSIMLLDPNLKNGLLRIHILPPDYFERWFSRKRCMPSYTELPWVHALKWLQPTEPSHKLFLSLFKSKSSKNSPVKLIAACVVDNFDYCPLTPLYIPWNCDSVFISNTGIDMAIFIVWFLINWKIPADYAISLQ